MTQQIIQSLTDEHVMELCKKLHVWKKDAASIIKLINYDFIKYAYAYYMINECALALDDWFLYKHLLEDGISAIDKYGFIPTVGWNNSGDVCVKYGLADIRHVLQCVPYQLEHMTENNIIGIKQDSARAFLKFDPMKVDLESDDIIAILNQKLLIIASRLHI